VFRDYDPSYKPEPYEVCRLPLRDVPAIETLCAEIGRVDLAENFAADDATVDHLRFYAIVVGGAQGRQAIFLRSYGPKKELSRRGGYALMMRQGAYNHVREKVFLFDDAVDCFAWDGVLYINNVDKFQRIFRYFEQLRATAEATVRGIAERVPILNLDEFVEAVRANSLMAAKVASIARKPYLPRVTIADIRRTIEEFDLDVAIESVGGTGRLIYDSSRDKRWLILKLLDDDYLGSVMTSEKYEVNSKSRR